ncbi:alpha/beta hydrolase [Sphingomonas populi]|uniref:Alpha/beta hydrolase n=2 Tax=Sphingomonas populi TaxID=2484750 RepID=A0A4Q6XP51_9SPHN|nr:alpha/beta hydrolase [Sphingomonas populi]
MISHLPLRLLAAAITPLLVLHTQAAHCAPAAAAVSAETRLDHISVAVTGKGSPVILIPGLSSPRATWDEVVPALAKSHRVYLVQINGFGGDAPGGNLKPGILDGVVSDLSGYIATNKLGQPAIVGHSLGGLVGLMFAKAHPDQLSRLMVVDSLPFYGMLFGPTATVAMIEPRGRAMRDQMIAQYGKPADTSGTEAVANGLALKPGSRTKVKAWMAAADPRVSGAAMYEDLTTDLRPVMPSITTPITLVYPWDVTNRPEAMVGALYKSAYGTAPHVTYVAVGDSAHFVMLDQPALFQQALETFLTH